MNSKINNTKKIISEYEVKSCRGNKDKLYSRER